MQSEVLVSFIVVSALVSISSAAAYNYTLSPSQSNLLQQIINFFREIIGVLFGIPKTTTTTTTTIAASTTTAAQHTTTIASTSTSLSTSSSTTLPTTSTMSTTSIGPGSRVLCHSDKFLRVNQTENCTPVRLLLIDVGPGNTQYEIANAIVTIYLNNQLVFANQSLLQNFTTPYQYNFSNGHLVQVQVYGAVFNKYPINRYANISLTYR